MSKARTTYDLDYRLASIEEIGFGLELASGFEAVPVFHFHVGLEATLNSEEKRMAIRNLIEVRAFEAGAILAHVVVNYIFDLEGIDTLEKSQAGIPVLPDSAQTSMNAVALSTSRGILFAKLKGTALHSAILPLIDAAKFAGRE